jgi:hypothetical protein
MRILGVDCGNVILYPFGGIVADSFESLEVIVRSRRFDAIYIVSRANAISRFLFLVRLQRANFWEKTGIPRENIYFCLKNRRKIDICKKLGVTDFIDDRISVLKHMESLEHCFVFNPKKSTIRKYLNSSPRLTSVRSWDELKPILLSLS